VAQRVALLFHQPVGIVEGCYRRRCEYDHTAHWRYTKHTRLDELAPTCDQMEAQRRATR
jgi:hypothetical protein